ncbi:MAG: tRNA lysidine(34) synthetase TilS [Aerococcaceae bacterium]|nr:tRNA lysidine(34) synthetase TilS [Aerococcaceae bacterium]
MEKLMRTVKSQLENWQEWQQAKTIVLAVSGGVDSMVLLKMLYELIQLRQYQDKRLVVAHFDHRLREDSALDAQLVKRVAEEYGLIYFSRQWETPAQQNIEARSRDARYAFFADVLEATEADVLMTAHHLNDVAETFMMRLTRGASLKALQGIQANYTRLFMPTSQRAFLAQVMRPFIQVPKQWIYDYAHKFQVDYREDVTNDSDQFMRNRFRKHYLPILEQENPQFLQNIWHIQAQLQASYTAHYADYLEQEPQLVTYSTKPYWILYVPAFVALTPEKRHIFLTLFFEERLVHDVPDYNREVIGQLEQMMLNAGEPHRRLQLGNDWVAIKRYDYVQLLPEQLQKENTFAQALLLERHNHWYSLGGNRRIGLFAQHQVTPQMKQRATALLKIDLSKITELPLRLRHRQAGDTMTFADKNGTTFHKKVSRMMIDRKIPQEMREEMWLLCDNQNTILWLLPDVIAKECYQTATDKTTHVIIYQETNEKEH